MSDQITTSKPFYESKILWIAVFSFVIEGIPIITQGEYSDWRSVLNAVVVPILLLVVRIFFSNERLTLN